ncbi:uncharacterized protein LACBIDRAFT_329824 [Laccaria bicolor S238N-H82]|uniref:Predicted protein n=1 Tax=Laccaria bicolor (strain S238N-H82 / ATCC MYA-4686) TaxID=486041 RepID=B0DJC2_LACBS|nr:uncharacterized protein LACBIDRAFT_329824 [Laccaria bicolor S238N-H82]EDR05379.1 predicted protein [Laccaria bicolor S238N-H82]|eukprot:XP_001883937.1 predicted protein [Laccaria bicolor S238N-H82]
MRSFASGHREVCVEQIYYGEFDKMCSQPTSDFGEEEAQAIRYGSTTFLPRQAKRPTVETRSWSYDKPRTHFIMQLPRKIVKRMERQIVDGVEVELEIEEVVDEPRKRLFLFPAPSRCS